MKNRVVIAIFVGLLLVGLAVTVGLVATFSGRPRPDPKDLSYWVRAAGDKDWSAEAAQSKPEAQFFLGLTLIRTNLVTMIDRIPLLSAVPLVGKRFEKITYDIDNKISQEQLAEAHQWIKKSADQDYAPAREAEKLFIGRVGAANGSQPSRAVSGPTSSAVAQ